MNKVSAKPKKNTAKTKTVQIKSEISFISPFQPSDYPKER